MSQISKLSVSSASLFKSCPRKFYYQNVLGWEPAIKAPWLSAGIAYDKLLEHYDVGGLHHALEAIPNLFSNLYEQVDARFLLAHYHDKFASDPLPPIENGNQLGFGVVYCGNEITGPCKYKVTGYIDKVTQRGNEVLIVERKTTSEPIEENSGYWAKLPLDPQIRSYVWYLRSQGANCGWVVYEVLRKLSKTVNAVYKKDCSLEEYTEKLLNYTEKKTLVARKRIFISEDMSDDFIVSHTHTHQAINFCAVRQDGIELSGYDGAYAWQQHEGSCNSFGGCPFKDVCENKVTLKQDAYVKSNKWLKNNGGN